MILWPISGIILGIAFVLWRTWNDDNSVLRFVYICLGMLGGCVLGPVMLLFFWEVRNVDKGHT